MDEVSDTVLPAPFFFSAGRDSDFCVSFSYPRRKRASIEVQMFAIDRPNHSSLGQITCLSSELHRIHYYPAIQSSKCALRFRLTVKNNCQNRSWSKENVTVSRPASPGNRVWATVSRSNLFCILSNPTGVSKRRRDWWHSQYCSRRSKGGDCRGHGPRWWNHGCRPLSDCRVDKWRTKPKTNQ